MPISCSVLLKFLKHTKGLYTRKAWRMFKTMFGSSDPTVDPTIDRSTKELVEDAAQRPHICGFAIPGSFKFYGFKSRVHQTSWAHGQSKTSKLGPRLRLNLKKTDSDLMAIHHPAIVQQINCEKVHQVLTTRVGNSQTSRTRTTSTMGLRFLLLFYTNKLKKTFPPRSITFFHSFSAPGRRQHLRSHVTIST